MAVAVSDEELLMRWFDFYYDECFTNNDLGEQHLIVQRPLLATLPTMFTAESDRPMHYKTKAAIATVHSKRNTLVRLLAAVEQIDNLVSRVARLPTTPITVYRRLHGIEDMACAAKDATLIGFHVTHRRVQELLLAVSRHDPMAKAAFVDLYLHEKAHIAQAFAGRIEEGHDRWFYTEKQRLKGLLVAALRANPRRDPFRRARYVPVLPDLTSFYEKVCS